MHKLLFANLFLFLYSTTFSQNIIGDWKGNIDVNSRQLPIIFHFYKDSSGNITGKWDSPAQKAMGLPFSKIEAEQDSVNLDISMIRGTYNGKFVNKDSIEGIWHQGGASLPLNFERFTTTKSPESTILYPNEKEIVIPTADGAKLYGTLLSKSNNQKLVIIIAGSGPTDRDGNNPLGDEANSYKLLAHALDSQGIATFRYDKRGVGKSIPSGFNESNLVFDDYARDVEDIFGYLHDILGFKNIYLAGHSEGSLIGMIASQKEKVKGYISIAGAGRPIDKVIEEQLSSQPLPDSLRKEISFIFTELKKGKEVREISPSLNPIFRKPIQPYMISWLRYDPTVEIRKLNCPVLILQGSCDKQVKIIDAELLHKADTKSELDIIPLMTHTLKNAGENCKNEDKTYTDPSLPIDKKLVEDIVGFIKKS